MDFLDCGLISPDRVAYAPAKAKSATDVTLLMLAT